MFSNILMFTLSKRNIQADLNTSCLDVGGNRNKNGSYWSI